MSLAVSLISPWVVLWTVCTSVQTNMEKESEKLKLKEELCAALGHEGRDEFLCPRGTHSHVKQTYPRTRESHKERRYSFHDFLLPPKCFHICTQRNVIFKQSPESRLHSLKNRIIYRRPFRKRNLHFTGFSKKITIIVFFLLPHWWTPGELNKNHKCDMLEQTGAKCAQQPRD